MTSRDPARLRQGLHPLTTTLGVFNSSLHSPISAVSMSSSHLQSAAQTPGSSTIQPYNPQEWVPSQAAVAVAERPVQFAGEAQVGPLPPPPYSPPRSQQQQQQQQQQQRPMSIYDSTPASTPPPRLNTAMHRPSPEPQIANPSFPPPPGGRGNSRERRFGIPTLARRRDVEQATSPPQTHMAHNHRQSMIIQPSFNQQNPDAAAGFPHGPPAARRAVSAGAIETPTSARSRSASQTRWEPGMPLPPPPPGPPPPSGRSQSVQSMDRNVVPIISPPTRRRPPAGVTNLGPVPPTPADWIDSDQPNAPGRGRSPALTLNTSVNPNPQLESVASSSSVSSLNRQKAVRHDKTILQRRNESRNRHSTRGSVDERIRPESMADIVVPSSSDLARSTLSKSTPLTDAFSQSSRDSTPRALGSAKLPQVEAETPPFSPNAAKQPQYASSKAVAPKALPTPPPRSGSAASVSRVRESSRPPSAGRAVPKHLAVTQTADQFATDTIERFREFAAKESRAATDADRVRLFADFIVNESRIRRERYSNAIGAMGSEIFDLTRDLFRPMATERRTSGTSQDGLTPGFSEPTRSRRGSASSAFQGESSQSAPGSANVPVSPNGANPPALNWATNYMPSLSPILSMSVSENYENGSSRGRPPSRWWETDSQGNPSHLERSKRESKYMGVTKTQWVEGDQPPAVYEDQGSSSEYPPEKTGWHDQSEPSLTPQPSAFSTSTSNMGSSPCSTVNREHLDVSRLVTMPPPYPRHHPAVNNNHPELTSIRTAVRALSELDQVTKTKEKFETESTQRREQFAQAASERRQALRTNLQNEINSGSLSYSDAAVIESDTQTGEISKKKELEKSEYEQFQNQVVLPLNELLMGRISRATELFDDLARHLIDNGIDADMPQEEGDDRPELLEKLTLLKWIFEAREGLHRAIYDLLSDRNSRYCGVVLTPYRLSGNTEKLKSAEAFFAEDAAKREYAYAHEVLERARDFRGVVEKAVERGVALQLSAFWDIAPPLCELLDNIPVDLEGFNIQIPAAEFEENPSYHEHPMQYLFSLILHAEKSTYQFIESHTNLLCLLHEVKEAVVHAKGKVLETQTQDENGNPIPKADRDARAQHMRQSEERRLTEDLKEKVRVVQDQWRSALGENITLVKERLGEWLLQMGGWDESLEDGGVGGV